MIAPCPLVDRDTAWRRLYGVNALFPWRCLFAAKPNEVCLELVYLPCYLVRLPAEARAFDVLVDASGGHAVMIDFAKTQWQNDVVPLGEPRISAADSIAAAMRLCGAMPGRRWLPRIALGEPRVEIVGYPYWVHYYERRLGKWDVRLLDAVTGNRAGAKTKVALLQTLAASRDRVSKCGADVGQGELTHASGARSKGGCG